MDLSVIIPYYNLPTALLQRCLDSFIPQLADTSLEWEVWVIDDGSDRPLDATRLTSPVLHPASQPPTSQLPASPGRAPLFCVRRPHGCPGSARNYGIRHARGEYILFIDADDYLFPDTLVPLLAHLFRHKPDLLRFRMKNVCTPVSRPSCKDSSPSPTPAPAFTPPVTGEAFMLHNNLPDSVTTYFFRRSLALEQVLIFTEQEYLEDCMFTTRLHHAAQSVVTTDAVVYAYYQRPGSIVNTRTRERAARLHVFHAKNLLAMAAFLKQEQAKAPAEGLRRKLAFFTIDYLHRISHDTPWPDIRDKELPWLHRHGLYPLPARTDYGWRYTAFHLAANTRSGLWLIQKLLWRYKPQTTSARP